MYKNKTQFKIHKNMFNIHYCLLQPIFLWLRRRHVYSHMQRDVFKLFHISKWSTFKTREILFPTNNALIQWPYMVYGDIYSLEMYGCHGIWFHILPRDIWSNYVRPYIPWEYMKPYTMATIYPLGIYITIYHIWPLYKTTISLNTRSKISSEQ